MNTLSRTSRRHFVGTLIAGAAAGGFSACRTVRPDAGIESSSPRLALPTARQIEWQDHELGMFIHYDMPVFKPGWNHRQYEQRPGPEAYNPARIRRLAVFHAG